MTHLDPDPLTLPEVGEVAYGTSAKTYRWWSDPDARDAQSYADGWAAGEASVDPAPHLAALVLAGISGFLMGFVIAWLVIR